MAKDFYKKFSLTADGNTGNYEHTGGRLIMSRGGAGDGAIKLQRADADGTTFRDFIDLNAVTAQLAAGEYHVEVDAPTGRYRVNLASHSTGTVEITLEAYKIA